MLGRNTLAVVGVTLGCTLVGYAFAATAQVFEKESRPTAVTEALDVTKPDQTDHAGGPVDGELVNPLGLGESLILVIGGHYTSEEDAAAAASVSHTEVQGLSVAKAADFQFVIPYAQVRPARSIITCGSGLRAEMAIAREWIDLTEQLAQDCRDRTSIELVRDESLSVDPLQCVPNAKCLDLVHRILGTVPTWPIGEWLTLSAFRTREGAEQYMTYLREIAGVQTFAVRALRLKGATDIGLGQEAAPEGSGPLLGPLVDQASYQ